MPDTAASNNQSRFQNWPSADTTDPREAMRYLMAVRDYVAQQTAPEKYRQYAHSGDPTPVRGDASKPAMLDASYEYGSRNLLSVFNSPVY